MLNLSWLGNCLGIMDIKLLVGRLKRFLLGLGSSASDSPARARRGRRGLYRRKKSAAGPTGLWWSSWGGNASICQLARFWALFLVQYEYLHAVDDF